MFIESYFSKQNKGKVMKNFTEENKCTCTCKPGCCENDKNKDTQKNTCECSCESSSSCCDTNSTVECSCDCKC